ncbi:n-Acetylglucosaminyltransferase-IV (GnT-IV) domain-containing protein [Hirsutella rhossiliensis]|uniref:N-Acetylglucosaminyltransferase-IV (GnT-IV) domain-containing protein n=1 Tax=Hirsutella rhossiliensis TaxID=111463 RepID=A0A9P8N2S8_9HYPO|nr:n-Acetylglucosaminyltransferase-IV (GnT-IV) domain-containing protein [Hirsutella rhossiliensis]KAH0964799.1 n-Acetylglucosaminyltransferase-IV (GnT-IV) domain-containing protein [Hirsutella rhossiliensis]
MHVSFLNILLGVSWLLLFRYCQIHSYADPGAFFFDAERAFTPFYSAARETEADYFLQKLPTTTAAADQPRRDSSSSDRICLGIPSIRRQGEQFLPRTVASLVDTLSLEQRRQLVIVVLLADDEPQINPAFGQAWLERLTDEVLVYADPSSLPVATNYRSINGSQQHDGASREKHVQLDYASLVDACITHDADYFALLEDDVIASRDWLARLRSSLSQIENMATPKDWLYLRLFYAEKYLGWNSEEWPSYSKNVALVYAAAAATVVLFRRVKLALLQPAKWEVRLHGSRRTFPAVQFNFWMLAFIGLYFMAGRLTVNGYQAGLREMERNGCCAQGLVFPSRHLRMLASRLKEPPHDLPGDSFIEQVADNEGLSRWAMVPSVLQHVGVRGSSESGGVRKTSWNFSFERL